MRRMPIQKRASLKASRAVSLRRAVADGVDAVPARTSQALVRRPIRKLKFRVTGSMTTPNTRRLSKRRKRSKRRRPRRHKAIRIRANNADEINAATSVVIAASVANDINQRSQIC